MSEKHEAAREYHRKGLPITLCPVGAKNPLGEGWSESSLGLAWQKKRWTAREIDRAWRLGEEMAKAEPARRREVFRQFVSRIDLKFDKIQRGKRTECPLKSGEIHLRSEEGTIFGSVNRGDTI